MQFASSKSAALGPETGSVRVAPGWSAFDVREARDGEFGGRRVRVEAAARAGRVFSIRAVPLATDAEPAFVFRAAPARPRE